MSKLFSPNFENKSTVPQSRLVTRRDFQDGGCQWCSQDFFRDRTETEAEAETETETLWSQEPIRKM